VAPAPAGDCKDKYGSCPNYKNKCWCPNIYRACPSTCNKCPKEEEALSMELQLGVGQTLQCPEVVTKANWEGTATYGDTFRVSLQGSKLEVRRTDKNHGWGMNLQFKCAIKSNGAPAPAPKPQEEKKDSAPTPVKDDCKDNGTGYTWRGCSRYKAGSPVLCSQVKHWCSRASWMKTKCAKTCDACSMASFNEVARPDTELLEDFESDFSAEVGGVSWHLRGAEGEEVVYMG